MAPKFNEMLEELISSVDSFLNSNIIFNENKSLDKKALISSNPNYNSLFLYYNYLKSILNKYIYFHNFLIQHPELVSGTNLSILFKVKGEDVIPKLLKKYSYVEKLFNYIQTKEELPDYFSKSELILKIKLDYDFVFSFFNYFITNSEFENLFVLNGIKSIYESHTSGLLKKETKFSTGRSLEITNKYSLQYNNFEVLKANYPYSLKKPMYKILFVSPGYDDLLMISGVSKVVYDLVNAFKENNVEVHTLMAWFGPTNFLFLSNGKIEKYSSFNEYLNSVSQYSYDLIIFHTFTINSSFDSPLLSRLIKYFSFDDVRIPIIYVVHSNEDLELKSYLSANVSDEVINFKKYTILAQKDLLRVSDKIISLTNYGKKTILDAYSNSITNLRDKVIVIPNMLEIPKASAGGLFSNIFKNTSSEEELTFLYLGRISPEKGIYEFAKLYDECFNSHQRKVKLNIVGSGEEEDMQYLKSLFSYSESSVFFHGFLTGEDKERLINESDVLVLPSRTETFGLVVAEAMLRELGVISTGLAVIKELFGDRIDYFVEQGDLVSRENFIEAKTKFLIFVRTYKKDFKKLTENKKYIIKTFGSKSIIDQYLNLFKTFDIDSYRKKKIEFSKSSSIVFDRKKKLGDFLRQNNLGSLKKILLLKKNNFSEVYLIELDEGSKYIFKIYSSEIKSFPLGNVSWLKETLILQELANLNLWIPKIFFEKVQKVGKENFYFAIQNYFSDSVLSSEGYFINMESYSRIYFSLGEHLSKLHKSLKFDRFGWISGNLNEDLNFNDWYHYLLESFNSLSLKLKLSDSKIKIITNHLSKYKNQLISVSPCLIHNDLHYDNFLIYRNKNIPEIWDFKGIIDFENCFVGHNVYDIVKLYEWMNDIYPDNTLFNLFLQGYSDCSIEEFNYYKDIYLLHVYMSSLVLKVNRNIQMKFDALLQIISKK
ncbi:MAG: glycosyltransferase [Nanoarchaeota archaeon]